MLKIQKNIPLAPYTTFKIGGPAKFFAEVNSKEDVAGALGYAKKNNLEVFVLGGGSNVLVSDQGFDGLVIKLGESSRSSRIVSGSDPIEFWAGDSLASAVNFAKENSLAGLEWAAGIPGTIGGAVRGNAGAFGGSMSDNVGEVRFLNKDNLKITEFGVFDCDFSYRNSIFKKNRKSVILSVRLKFNKGDKDAIDKKIKEIIAKRTGGQPQGVGSAGSFFENPLISDQKLIKEFEKDTNSQCRGDKIPAGWLIEQAGLRGKKIGQIQVSEKHANFVINLGEGKAEDVVILVSLIKQQVRDKFGVELMSEVELVGF